MKRNFQSLIRPLFNLAFIVLVIGSYVIAAQTIVTGDWKATYKPEKENKIHLTFSRQSSEKRGRNTHGMSFDLSDLQGLSGSRLSATADENVKFSIVREAGTIECEGRFSNGRGAGTFRFTANPQFVSAMRSRGFDFEKSSKSGDNDSEDEPGHRLLAAATLNVTTALADDLLSANLGKLDTGDLFKAAIFKIDSKFMREMKASGFPNLGMEELVKAKIFKIDAEFLRELNAQGFGSEPFENVVKMRIFKITPEFITGVRSEGFQNLDIEDLVKMKIFNINAEFIRQARAEGVPLEVEKLVQKRIGVWRNKF